MAKPSDDVDTRVMGLPGRAGPPPRPAAREELPAGSRVGDYLVRERIAEGGFGAVYRVEHALLGRAAALKVMHRELAGHEDVYLRFEREARAVNQIRHEAVIDIYDFGRLPDDRRYFLMELLEGEDLGQRLGRRGALPPAEVLEIAAPLCGALDAAHARGIVHRDVKASNVFLAAAGERERVVLLDFGIAKLLDPAEPGLTASRVILGTPACMAPEQIAGRPVDGRTDLYALGVLLFHCLTGEQPFHDESTVVMQQLHLEGPRPRASRVALLPSAVDEVLARAMAVAPADRFATAGALLSALTHALSFEPSARRVAVSRAVGLHVEVRTPAGALEAPDDDLLDDLDRAHQVVRELATQHGFTPAIETTSAVLFVRPIAAPTTDAAERRDALRLAQQLVDALAARPSAGPRAHVNVCVHAGSVRTDESGRAIDGDLFELVRWVPEIDVDGVAGTAAVFEGLALGTEPLPHRRLSRLIRRL